MSSLVHGQTLACADSCMCNQAQEFGYAKRTTEA